MDFEVNSDVRIDEFVSFKYRIMSVLSSFPEVAHQIRREIIQLEAKRKYLRFQLQMEYNMSNSDFKNALGDSPEILGNV